MINHLRVNREGRNTMATLKYSRQRESIKRVSEPEQIILLPMWYMRIWSSSIRISASVRYIITYLCWLIWEKSEAFLFRRSGSLWRADRGTATSCVSDVSGSSTLKARNSPHYGSCRCWELQRKDYWLQCQILRPVWGLPERDRRQLW